MCTRSAPSIHLSLEIPIAFGQVKPQGLAWQPSRHTKTCFSLRLHFYRRNLKFHFHCSIMEQTSSSRPRPQRSASALSAHRVSPYSSRSSSAGPLSENLTFIRTLLNEIADSQELNLDVFPPPPIKNGEVSQLAKLFSSRLSVQSLQTWLRRPPRLINSLRPSRPSSPPLPEISRL